MMDVLKRSDNIKLLFFVFNVRDIDGKANARVNVSVSAGQPELRNPE